MTDNGASRWRLGFTPERRWTEWEQLAREPVLLARLGAGGAALVATGVRELLTNVVQHGCPGASDAELRLDGGAGTLQLIIPGNAFDSVSLTRDDPRGFLSCFGAMLAEDGIEWSHRYEDGNNHLLLSLAGARIWRRAEEKSDEKRLERTGTGDGQPRGEDHDGPRRRQPPPRSRDDRS